MTAARQLLGSMYREGYRYKKTGVFLGDLASEDSYQPSLFDAPSTSSSRLDIDKIVDEINRQLGDPKNPVVTRGAMGNPRFGKAWEMRRERHSPCYTTNWTELPIVRP